MNSRRLNRSLLTIITVGWLSFLVVGVMIDQVFATTKIILLIERSYCSPSDWQQVVQAYTDLYQQHQQQSLEIKSLVLFSDLGEEIRTTLPTPEELQNLRTYGRSTSQRQAEVVTKYKQAKAKIKVLSCP